MTFYIGSARHDERGKYSGGKKGDQKNGEEVSTQKFYNKIGGWNQFRAVDDKVREKLRDAMIIACANNHLGYSQSDRYGVIRNGITTGTDTNCDCSSLVRACIIYATGKDIGDFTTASAENALLKSGLFVKVGTMTSSSLNVYNGDIICTKKKGHIAIITSGAMENISSTPKGVVKKANANISMGQKASVNFTGHNIAIDGLRGSETKKQAVRVVQRALNKDYGCRIAEDGSWGPATDRAFGSHYVKKGETQWLVTAAEILCYLAGLNPNGVEYAGHFGKGLANASGKTYLDKTWFKKMCN